MRYAFAALAVAAAACVLPRPVCAGVRIAPRPTLLRLRGRVGPPPAGRQPAASLTLELRGRRVPFQVESAYVLQGQRLGADVLADVQPYDPNLFVRGPHELLDRLARAGPADAVEMIGYVRTSSRVLLLSAVTIAPAG